MSVYGSVHMGAVILEASRGHWILGLQETELLSSCISSLTHMLSHEVMSSAPRIFLKCCFYVQHNEKIQQYQDYKKKGSLDIEKILIRKIIILITALGVFK